MRKISLFFFLVFATTISGQNITRNAYIYGNVHLQNIGAELEKIYVIDFSNKIITSDQFEPKTSIKIGFGYCLTQDLLLDLSISTSNMIYKNESIASFTKEKNLLEGTTYNFLVKYNKQMTIRSDLNFGAGLSISRYSFYSEYSNLNGNYRISSQSKIENFYSLFLEVGLMVNISQVFFLNSNLSYSFLNRIKLRLPFATNGVASYNEADYTFQLSNIKFGVGLGINFF